jgi:Peptidase family M28/PDZ domain
VMLTRSFANELMADAGEPSLTQLEKDIDGDLKPRSRELKGWTLSEQIVIERTGIETKNVVGVLEGAGPHADETVVIGGHYDHLGHGGLTSGSLAMFSSAIHNGADDNASGTTMALELARRLGARRDPLPRRVVFIAFSGEERGLLGSQYYVSHPLFPLKKTVMMINCDMVGRMNAKNELTMIGTGSSPGMDALVDVLGKSAGLTIKKVTGMSDGFGGSDHESFYSKGVPVIFAFTGLHNDYHRPSDDSDRINYPGMARIADYLELIALDVVRRPQRPVFAKLGEGSRPARTAAAPARGRATTSLGVMPDYSHEAKDGLSLAGVREGGPAAKAGLKEGDLITKLGGLPIGTIYDYMSSMEKHQPGDKVDVVVKRDGKEVTLEVTLGGRPRE